MIGTEEPQARVPHGRRNVFIVATLVVLLLLAVFVPPLINLGKYRRSITRSISAALGRPVEVGAMQLRLLPTPGIELSGLTVAEDPAFGYEPGLHANSVVVRLRLSSLWRGRLEVGRISLDEASVNLVRSGTGQWNIGSILLRASQIPNEATANRHAGSSPRFPYIEATNARINFKEGVEKRPFSLTNAEFAMWQANSGEWRIRLKAQPVRTDLELHLSDAGALTVEGSLRRAAEIHSMPLNLQAEWRGAQLGQASRLLFGADSGWRGDLDVTTSMQGNAGDLALKTRVQIADLQRQEFQPANSLDVDATCQSRYQHAERLLSDITCFLPAGSGHFLLTGTLQAMAPAATDLQLEVNQVPAQFPITLLGLMRPKAGQVAATGAINGSFHWVQGAQTSLTGDATATGVTVKYANDNLTLPDLHFVTETPEPRGKKLHRSVNAPPPHEPAAIFLEPVAVPFGAAAPLTMDARVRRAGFALHFAGAASMDRLVAAASSFGYLGRALGAVRGNGRADMDLRTSGTWIPPAVGDPGMSTTGTARVQNVQLRPGFLPAPVDIASADIDFSPATIAWQNVAFHYQDLSMHGSLQLPATCAQGASCPATFALQPGDMDCATVESLVAGKRPGFFGQMLADLGQSRIAGWPPLHGTVQWSTLNVGHLALHNASAMVDVAGTSLTLDSLDAGAMGGTLHAKGDMSVENGTPHWNLTARLTGIKAPEAAAAFRERWGTGTASGEVQLKFSGLQTSDLTSSAVGTFALTWTNGELSGGGATPLARFDRWAATGTIQNKTVTLTTGKIVLGTNAIAASGDIGFDRGLNLALKTGRGSMVVGGTLVKPSITQ
jgi:AsmA family/AsmA-like C-terminal region